MVFAEAGQFDRAEEEFLRALAADPQSAAAHSNWGLLLQRKGRFYDAAVAFASAVRFSPRAIEPRMNLGRLYESVGWREAAEKEYRDVLSIDAENTEAKERLARLTARPDRRSQQPSQSAPVVSAK